MKNIAIAAFVLICLVVAAAASRSAEETETDTPDGAPTRWQHLALSSETVTGIGEPKFSRQINQLGRDGWELIDVECVTRDGTTTRTLYFFKRKLSQPSDF